MSQKNKKSRTVKYIEQHLEWIEKKLKKAEENIIVANAERDMLLVIRFDIFNILGSAKQEEEERNLERNSFVAELYAEDANG